MRKIIYTFFALFVALAMISCSDNGVDIIDIGNGDDNGNGDEEGMIYSVTFNVEGGGQFTFSVDMEGATIEGEDLPDDFDGDVYTFDPENDRVMLTGSMLGWSEPGSGDSVELTTGGASGGTIDAGEAQFKFFILPSGVEQSWSYGEWEGDPNRSTDIAGGADYHDVWGNKAAYENGDDNGDENGDASAPESLFMIGEAVGSWVWDDVNIPLIPVHENNDNAPGLYWRIVWLEADTEGFKFAPERDWGSDFGYDGNDPVDEIYQSGSTNIPAPDVSGYYMVVVNWIEGSDYEIAVTEPLVYLNGDIVGGWDGGDADALFTVDNDNEVLTITRDLEEGHLRIYAWFDKGWFTDWWHSEFVIRDGEIEYRGDGNDQEPRVNLDAGNYTIDLNFRTGNGTITEN